MLKFGFCQNSLFFFFNIIIFPNKMLFNKCIFIVCILDHGEQKTFAHLIFISGVFLSHSAILYLQV